MRKVSVWINFVLILLTSNFWRAEIFLGRFLVRSATSESSPSAKCVGLFFPNLLLAGPESSVQHQEEAFFFFWRPISTIEPFLLQSEEKWLLQTTECLNGSTKSALFAWTNLTHCCFKFASFGNLCSVCPVLFELLETGRHNALPLWKNRIYSRKL